MAPTRFTCTLTKADEPGVSPTHASRSWTLRVPPAVGVLGTGSLHSTASAAPGLTAPTPEGSTSGNGWPWSWPKNEASSANC